MKIKACRICGNKKLIEIGSLGDIAISDFTDAPQEGTKYPLTLVYCEKCTLLQLLHTTPRNLLYKNYWYESRLNPVIVKDLKEIASHIKQSDTHMDIGGNDGTLLKYSKAYLKSGCDPSNIHPFDIEYSTRWYKDYWENYDGLAPFSKITAIACLYDTPDPNKFIKNIKNWLLPDGIFISQLMTLQPMIENNDVGNICHEHLEYYSYKSLVYLFEQNGLEIFKVEKNKINGGSYRIFARHFKKGSIVYPEKEYGVKELKEFFEKIEENRLKFWNYFGGEKRLDGYLYFKYQLTGYGASTKANTILQYYQINNKNFPFLEIVDINPNKKGKYCINTKIPITNKIVRNTQYLWVFPYGFIDYFKKKEKGYKGKWLVTIPNFKIYD